MTDYTIEDMLDRVDIVDMAANVYGLDLKKKGVEYESLCCFHKEKTPSLTFTPTNQTYYCFGCGAGGNAYNFIKDHEQLSDKETVKRLKQIAGIADDDGRAIEKPEPRAVVKQHNPLDDWDHIFPVPVHAPKLIQGGKATAFNPKVNATKTYTPEADGVYAYRDAHGNLLGAILRCIFSDGKKQFLPVTYCVNKNTGEESWILKGFDDNRPIYLLDTLKGHEEVLVVEGEKCAKAASIDIGHAYDVVSWMGGTKAIDKTDWSPLYGMKVTLWADNDIQVYKRGANEGKVKPQDEQNGRMAMIWLKKHLEANGCTVTLLDQPIGKPDNWDCSDAKEEGYDLIQYIADHTPEPEQYSDDEEHDQPQQKLDIAPQGYDEGRFYYYSRFTKQIKMLRDRDHTKNSLLGIAPLEWWKSGFQNSKDGVDWDAATSWMMNACRVVGIFNKRRIRGRGCWMDDGRFVMHLGDRLVVDNTTVDIGGIRSNYLYQAAERKKAPSNPLGQEEAKGLLEAAKAFDWDMPASAALLAGFCVLAPICGMLEWRPHLWINGGSGSGKSTVTKSFTRKLIGDMGVYITLNSSVAGLRQTLKSDAFPVMVEEFDPKNKSTNDKAQEYFDMMRDSSDDTENPVLRGNPSGEVMEYSSNSMFYLVGVQVCTTEQAVLNRTAILSLRSRPDKTAQQKARNKENWGAIQSTIYEKIDTIDDVASRLLARTIGMIDIIRDNIKTFRSAANTHFGNARYADQYGTLLAGSYSLVSDCRVTEEVALNYIKVYDWSVYTEDSDDDESMLALSSIMQLRIRVAGGVSIRDITVAEAIDEVRNSSNDADDAHSELKRMGIVCKDDCFVIANRSEALTDRLEGKPWGQQWGRYLKRIITQSGEHVKSTENPIRFGAMSQRGTEIPYGIVFGEDDYLG